MIMLTSPAQSVKHCSDILAKLFFYNALYIANTYHLFSLRRAYEILGAIYVISNYKIFIVLEILYNDCVCHVFMIMCIIMIYS